MDKLMSIYLAGAIERAPDKGAKWRQVVTPALEVMGFEVVNPLDFDVNTIEKHGFDIHNVEKEKSEACVSGRYITAMSDIVRTDLEALLSCDVMLAYLDKYIGAGTLGEITAAHMKDIPIFILSDLPFDKLSGWVFGCMTNISRSWDTTHKQLKDWIARGEVRVYDDTIITK